MGGRFSKAKAATGAPAESIQIAVCFVVGSFQTERSGGTCTSNSGHRTRPCKERTSSKRGASWPGMWQQDRPLSSAPISGSQTVMVFNDFWSEGVTKRATLEFARDRKSMSVLCSDPEVQPENVLYVKGALAAWQKPRLAVQLPHGWLERLRCSREHFGQVLCRVAAGWHADPPF